MTIDNINVEKIFNLAFKNHKENNFNEAEKLYKKILKINSSHFNSIFYLSSLCAFKKKYNEAKELLEKAILVQPNHVSAHNNLGAILLKLGDYNGALISFQNATQINPNDVSSKNNLAVLLRSSHLSKINIKKNDNSYLKSLFLTIFRRNDVYHIEIFDDAKFVLFSEKKYHQLYYTKNLNTPLLKNLIIQDLLNEELFVLMLQKSIIKDVFLEKMLTDVRCEILFNIENSKENILYDNLRFAVALSQQCFFNEYVFFQTSKEIKIVNKLITTIEKKEKINEIEVAILGCYLPLYSLKNIVKKLANYKSENILFNDLINMQINEPLKEKKLINSIKSLSKISDKVSLQVKDQYEKNPYPRWRYTYSQITSPFLAKLERQIRPNKIKIQNRFDKLKILVAGCGTGQHVCIAKDYLNANILAIDLSLQSLAYAKRKTDELGFDNIEYLHADILELNKLKKKFDVIECVGVLHHMEKPMKGLEILLNLLEPHGVMKLGLYSDKARQHIVHVREFIKKNKFNNTIDGIRECRKSIINRKEDKMFKEVLNRSDFYTLSSARDLMFHAYEHRFNLSQISKMISDFDLEFLGFTEEKIKYKYSKKFPDDKENTILENWHKFEILEPGTFIGMYNFWLRKKIQ